MATEAPVYPEYVRRQVAIMTGMFRGRTETADRPAASRRFAREEMTLAGVSSKIGFLNETPDEAFEREYAVAGLHYPITWRDKLPAYDVMCRHVQRHVRAL